MPDTTSAPAQGSDLAAARPRGRPFPKGKSGNPGGSSRLRRETSKKYLAACGEVADFLLRVMRDESAPLALRVRAAEAINLRGLGRPADAPEPSTSTSSATIILQQLAPGTPPRDEESDNEDPLGDDAA